MNPYLDEIDNNIIGKTKENGKVIDFRVWTQKRNICSDRIFPQIIHHSSLIKRLTGNLYEEKKDKNLSKSYLYKFKKIKQTSSLKNIFKVSPYVEKIIGKVEKKIDYINNSTNEISRMTSLYLEKKTMDNKSLDFRNINNKNNNENTNLNNNERNDKNIKIRNFSYISEHYRKQLRKAFLKFNPLIHLENINLLQKIDPLIKEDLNNLKKTIDYEISQETDKYKFSKKFQRLKEKNKKNLFSSDNLSNSQEINLKINKSNEKLTPLKKPLLFFKKNEKKKNHIKDEKLEEIYILMNSSSSIKGMLSKKNMEKKINQFIEDYNERKINKKKLESINYFQDDKNNIQQSLGKFYIFKLNKIINDNEKKLQFLLNKDNDSFSKKLNNIKDSFNKELNSNFEKYNINLNIISQ